MIRAFKTKAIGTTSIVFAESAGKARTATVRSANDAGYKISYPDVTVHRSPEFDCRKWKDGGNILPPNCCYKPEDLMKEVSR